MKGGGNANINEGLLEHLQLIFLRTPTFIKNALKCVKCSTICQVVATQHPKGKQYKHICPKR